MFTELSYKEQGVTDGGLFQVYLGLFALGYMIGSDLAKKNK